MGGRSSVQFIPRWWWCSELSLFIQRKYFKAQSTPLHIATSSGHLHIAVLLLQTGFCDVNAINNLDQTALFYTASKNWIEICEVLIAAGGDPNIGNQQRTSPMHKAAAKDHYQILKMLLDAGGHIDCKDCDGNTPLHLACEKNHIRSINLLVERGANMNLVNKTGHKPFDLCSPSIKSMLAED
eukprot:sb/3471558/